MLAFELDHDALCLGIVRARQVTCQPSPPALLQALSVRESALAANPSLFSEPVRTAIRDLLRKGGYKPTGRGKPASEFLLGAARELALPRINNLVDIISLVSLESALPISIFDAELLGDELSVRLGLRDEGYVFNASGQVMDVAGLPVVCRGSAREAVGNAVKDSMLTKVHAGTVNVLAVVYGSRALPRELLIAACERLSALLAEHAGASETSFELMP